MSPSQSIRISTWNLDHASNSKRPVDLQIEQILRVKPDILVLTETCQEVDLTKHGFTCFPCLTNNYGKFYSAIHIGPRISLSKKLRTYDETTAVCVQVATPVGEMIVYGTIITYHGDKGPNNNSPAWAEHYKAIGDHGNDWARLIHDGGGNLPFFVAGDFNQTRDGSSKTYGTKLGRNLLSEELSRNNLTCLTTENFKLRIDPIKGLARNNVDHICMTRNAFQIVNVGAWDHFNDPGQYLSDHNGVYVELGPAA